MVPAKRNVLELRKTSLPDLDTFFLFQLDEESNHMAAFTAKDPADREAYFAKWSRIIADPSINMQSIVCDGALVGSVFVWLMDGEPQISYGVGRQFWGRGIATEALRMYLALETVRPLYGRVAFDNPRSQKVLESCGFIRTGTEHAFANARGAEIEEFVYVLA
jgi:[ribosomal protein S5]-alanine N-acetyltransferase